MDLRGAVAEVNAANKGASRQRTPLIVRPLLADVAVDVAKEIRKSATPLVKNSEVD
jgi:hypothetical protein